MLTRRRFLQFVGTGATAPVLSRVPVATAAPAMVAGVEFQGPIWFDFGYQIGMGIRLRDGRRHAVRMVARDPARKPFPHNFPPRDVAMLKARLLDWAIAQC